MLEGPCAIGRIGVILQITFVICIVKPMYLLGLHKLDLCAIDHSFACSSYVTIYMLRCLYLRPFGCLTPILSSVRGISNLLTANVVPTPRKCKASRCALSFFLILSLMKK